MAWRRGFVDRNKGDPTAHAPTSSTEFVSEKGGNDAPATYQDASGAPVESDSPLGYSVGPITITLLNVTMMIGAGIYSTRMFIDYSLVMNTPWLTPGSLFDLRWDRISWSFLCLLDPGVFGTS
jgi:hypothetical protein